MPASLHKILCHSKNIIMTLRLSPAFFGEVGAESYNKYYRQNRRYHSQKCSRKSSLFDVFNRALDSSDPIVSLAKLDIRSYQEKQVSEDVKNFLLFKNYEQEADWDTTTGESNFMDLNEGSLIDYFEDMDLAVNFAYLLIIK